MLCCIFRLSIFNPQPFDQLPHALHHALSGLASRLHAIYTYTFPPHNATAAAEALVQLYAQKGHDLHARRRFLREKDPFSTALSLRRFRLVVCVCVCHTLVLRVFHVPTSFSTEAGALSTPWQTQCNEAMPWSGKHGLITRVYLRELFHTL